MSHSYITRSRTRASETLAQEVASRTRDALKAPPARRRRSISATAPAPAEAHRTLAVADVMSVISRSLDENTIKALFLVYSTCRELCPIADTFRSRYLEIIDTRKACEARLSKLLSGCASNVNINRFTRRPELTKMHITIKTSDRSAENMRLYVDAYQPPDHLFHIPPLSLELINGKWVNFDLQRYSASLKADIKDLLPFMEFPSIKLRICRSANVRLNAGDVDKVFRVELDGSLARLE